MAQERASHKLYDYATNLYLSHQKKGNLTLDICRKCCGIYEQEIRLKPAFPDSYLLLGIVLRHRALLQMTQDSHARGIVQMLNTSLDQLSMAIELDGTLSEKAETEIEKTRALRNQISAILELAYRN